MPLLPSAGGTLGAGKLGEIIRVPAPFLLIPFCSALHKEQKQEEEEEWRREEKKGTKHEKKTIAVCL